MLFLCIGLSNSRNQKYAYVICDHNIIKPFVLTVFPMREKFCKCITILSSVLACGEGSSQRNKPSPLVQSVLGECVWYPWQCLWWCRNIPAEWGGTSDSTASFNSFICLSCILESNHWTISRVGAITTDRQGGNYPLCLLACSKFILYTTLKS